MEAIDGVPSKKQWERIKDVFKEDKPLRLAPAVAPNAELMEMIERAIKGVLPKNEPTPQWNPAMPLQPHYVPWPTAPFGPGDPSPFTVTCEATSEEDRAAGWSPKFTVAMRDSMTVVAEPLFDRAH